MPALYQDDEEKPDFRSRYATETAGMPDYLAAAASKNLAAEDASLIRVNAASRIAAQSTPPGEPLGPIPTSDLRPPTSSATSLADLHTDDIATRRAAIDDQKKQIMARLGVIQPREAGLAAVVLAAPHERKDLLDNWHMLDQEDKGLLQEHHYNAVDSARSAHENLARQLHIQSSAGMAKILNGIAEIEHPMGTDEHTAAAFKILGSNDPDIAAARGTPGFEKILGPYAQQAKTSAERAARIKEAASQGADQYYSMEALQKENPGAEGRQDPKTGGFYVALAKPVITKDVPANAQARYAKLTATVQKHEEDSAAEEAQNKSSKQADVPYSKASDYHAAKTELSLLQKRFPGLSTEDAPAATTPAAVTTKPEDDAAIAWAKANPADPRAAAIKKLHGIE